MKKSILLAVFLTAMIIPITAQAHLDGEGIIDGEYKVELGQSSQDIKVGEDTSFSLAMESLLGERVSEMNAWIRLSLGDSVVFSSTDMSTKDGTIDFSFNFLEPGEYEIKTRVRDASTEDQEANAVFTLEVKGDLQEDVLEEPVVQVTTWSNKKIIALLVIIFFAGFAVKGWKKKS